MDDRVDASFSRQNPSWRGGVSPVYSPSSRIAPYLAHFLPAGGAEGELGTRNGAGRDAKRRSGGARRGACEHESISSSSWASGSPNRRASVLEFQPKVHVLMSVRCLLPAYGCRSSGRHLTANVNDTSFTCTFTASSNVRRSRPRVPSDRKPARPNFLCANGRSPLSVVMALLERMSISHS